MAQRVWVIDSNGNSTRQRMGWVKKQKGGQWINGAYVFPPAGEQRVSDQVAAALIVGSPGNRAASLFGRQWAQPDTREFVADPSYWDGRACLRFWADQSSHGGRV